MNMTTCTFSIAAIALFIPMAAMAAPPIVNLVTVNVGTPVHLTPTGFDSLGNPASLAGAICTVVGFPNVLALPTSLVVVTYDLTGAIMTAAGAGSGTAQWRCQNGSAVVSSASFTVTVPWNVTQVGDTSP